MRNEVCDPVLRPTTRTEEPIVLVRPDANLEVISAEAALDRWEVFGMNGPAVATADTVLCHESTVHASDDQISCSAAFGRA
jgi:hypothetical protein